MPELPDIDPAGDDSGAELPDSPAGSAGAVPAAPEKKDIHSRTLSQESLSFLDAEPDDLANVGALLQQTRMSEFFMHDSVRTVLKPRGAVTEVWAANTRFEISKVNSNSRELELTNLLGLVLGCIEAKFRK